MALRIRAVRFLVVCALPMVAACTAAPDVPGCVECLWVIPRGGHRTTDLSRWTGEDPGRPWQFANHCYLIRHRDGLLLWDTGYADAIAALSGGLSLAGGVVHIELPATLGSQLEELGIGAADITHLAFSHFHLDHVGNAVLFPTARLFAQGAELAAAFGGTPERFGFDPELCAPLRRNPTAVLDGDHDVFGDGSVTILATPGHTPGHQSLLVRLPETGPVILSGDVAHLRANWAMRRVPGSNFDAEASRRSMQRLADVQAATGAQLWLNHDWESGVRLHGAPRQVR